MQTMNPLDLVVDEVSKAILGKKEMVELVLAAFLANGHVLLEDVPGVGKTQFVKAFAQVLQGTFSRVQGTPDLLPSDITGVTVYNHRTTAFEFRPGPVFTTILLVDELNRTSPRTQSALLEAMAEAAVTMDGTTYPLDPNFFTLATQNPLDFEGTYPLPEASLDRFLISLSLGYPSPQDELSLMKGAAKTPYQVRQVIDQSQIAHLKDQVDTIYADDLVVAYAYEFVSLSRKDPKVALGISPRAAISLIRLAKAYALVQGRGFVTPGDIQKLIPYVFGHRLVLKGAHRNQAMVEDILLTWLGQVPVPVRR